MIGGHFIVADWFTIPTKGSQYVSIRYTERLAGAGIDPSVGSVGDSYDNALAESVIGLFKTEFIQRLGPWKSFEAVEYKTLEWVDWFNRKRPMEPIGNIPPAEAEENYPAALENLRMAAQNSSNPPSGKPSAVHVTPQQAANFFSAGGYKPD